MKAIVRDRYGAPDVLRIEDVPIPEVADDAVLVRVRASSVNAYDWHVLRGKPYLARLGEGLRRPKARALGLDVAGEVEAVGPAVTQLAVGDRVYGSRLGAFAEYVASRSMMPMPATLSFEQAAAVPVAAQTALQGLRDRGKVEAGERVLVIGAGGGVGTFAVQLARVLGASHVTATTNAGSLELVRSLGADAVVDRARDDGLGTRDAYDVILDIGGTRRLSALRRALRRRGRAVLVAPQPGQWIGPVARVAGAVIGSRFSDRAVIPFLSSVSTDDLRQLAGLLEAGRIRPVIDHVYRFEQIPEAIRHVEEGRARGKVVVTIG